MQALLTPVRVLIRLAAASVIVVLLSAILKTCVLLVCSSWKQEDYLSYVCADIQLAAQRFGLKMCTCERKCQKKETV